MTGVPHVVLDACVIANFSLCHLLLRLAEPPRLFEPRWSEKIMEETLRTLKAKLGWPAPLVAHFESELQSHFRGAWVSGYESLIPLMRNDEKDRHVVAAAAHCGALRIVTFNLRHFPRVQLDAWNIQAVHPQDFLAELYHRESSLVLAALHQQAADRDRALQQLLKILSATVPAFSNLISVAESNR
jgi:hypothetical protein